MTVETSPCQKKSSSDCGPRHRYAPGKAESVAGQSGRALQEAAHVPSPAMRIRVMGGMADIE
eukprot:7216747-Alexandrium_andersonii.AAC.1